MGKIQLICHLVFVVWTLKCPIALKKKKRSKCPWTPNRGPLAEELWHWIMSVELNLQQLSLLLTRLIIFGQWFFYNRAHWLWIQCAQKGINHRTAQNTWWLGIRIHPSEHLHFLPTWLYISDALLARSISGMSMLTCIPFPLISVSKSFLYSF